MSNDVLFLEITPSKDQDLQANYSVNVNLVTHPRDWIGIFHVNKT
jgi:hypothetical protein